MLASSYVYAILPLEKLKMNKISKQDTILNYHCDQIDIYDIYDTLIYFKYIFYYSYY